MQMKVRIDGEGLSYRGIGVNFGKRAVLLFRNAPDEGVLALRMEDSFDIAGDGSIMIVSHLATQWFAVNVSAHEWLFDIPDMAGRFAELRLSGGSLGNVDHARVDIDFRILDGFGEIARRLVVRDRPVIDDSYNFGDFEIGAKLKHVDAEKIVVYDPDGYGHFERTTDTLEK